MITLVSILFLGFFLGLRHATDSDHVIAVTTIVSRQRSIASAALTGVFWGIGHSLTLLVVGGAIIFFGVVVPARLGMGLEFCVALMLVLLGLMNFRSTARDLEKCVTEDHHNHVHRHGDYIHTHPHGHAVATHGHSDESVPPARLDRVLGGIKGYWTLRPLVIGVVHGLAGSAAVALLVLPVIQRPAWAIAYLCVFGCGTLAGMMLMTATIAIPVTYGARYHLFQRYSGPAAGALSVCFGLFLCYQIGFVQGLFTR